MSELSDFVKKKRKATKLTQQELAERAGVGFRSQRYSRFGCSPGSGVTAKAVPTPSAIQSLSKVKNATRFDIIFFQLPKNKKAAFRQPFIFSVWLE